MRPQHIDHLPYTMSGNPNRCTCTNHNPESMARCNCRQSKVNLHSNHRSRMRQPGKPYHSDILSRNPPHRIAQYCRNSLPHHLHTHSKGPYPMSQLRKHQQPSQCGHCYKRSNPLSTGHRNKHRRRNNCRHTRCGPRSSRQDAFCPCIHHRCTMPHSPRHTGSHCYRSSGIHRHCIHRFRIR